MDAVRRASLDIWLGGAKERIMPTYEYACTSCGHEWEAEQSIKDNALTDCPSCSAAAAKRQISRNVGFILKGGGWYSDLYSSSSNKKSEGSAADASGKSGETPAATKSADGSGAKTGGGESGGSGSKTGGGESGGSSSTGGTSGGGSTGSSGSSTPSTAASAA
jgi:putative FmdB family regulatory protein